MNHEETLKPIQNWLQRVKFKRQFLGGVNEADVWRKIQELDRLYQQALRDQEVYYQALLDHKLGRDDHG